MNSSEEEILKLVGNITENRRALLARLEESEARFKELTERHKTLKQNTHRALTIFSDIVLEQHKQLEAQEDLVRVARHLTSDALSALQYGSHYGHRQLYEAIKKLKK